MPSFTKDTSKDVLKKQAEEDVARIKKTTQYDGDGREYKWNEDIGFFESEADDAGKKWVKGIDSSVPGYWFTCPEIVGSNSKGYDIVCATPHFVFIFQDGEKLTCRKCNKESTVKLVLPEE
jgi:hypothetical protein